MYLSKLQPRTDEAQECELISRHSPLSRSLNVDGLQVINKHYREVHQEVERVRHKQPCQACEFAANDVTVRFSFRLSPVFVLSWTELDLA